MVVPIHLYSIGHKNSTIFGECNPSVWPHLYIQILRSFILFWYFISFIICINLLPLQSKTKISSVYQGGPHTLKTADSRNLYVSGDRYDSDFRLLHLLISKRIPIPGFQTTENMRTHSHAPACWGCWYKCWRYTTAQTELPAPASWAGHLNQCSRQPALELPLPWLWKPHSYAQKQEIEECSSTVTRPCGWEEELQFHELRWYWGTWAMKNKIWGTLLKASWLWWRV